MSRNTVYYKIAIRDKETASGGNERWLEFHCNREAKYVIEMQSLSRGIRVACEKEGEVYTAEQTAEWVLEVMREVRDYSLQPVF